MSKETKQPVLTPPKSGDSSAWSTKIEKAKAVREGAAKIREGKPIAFPTHRVRD